MKKIIRWMPAGSAVAALGTVYVVWLVAYWQLGHRPVPMMNDPAYVGGFVDVPLVWADRTIIALLFCWMAGVVISVISVCLPKTKDLKWWAKNLVAAALSALLILVMIESSPGSAVQWYMD
jgi:hypothetical protein